MNRVAAPPRERIRNDVIAADNKSSNRSPIAEKTRMRSELLEAFESAQNTITAYSNSKRSPVTEKTRVRSDLVEAFENAQKGRPALTASCSASTSSSKPTVKSANPQITKKGGHAAVPAAISASRPAAAGTCERSPIAAKSVMRSELLAIKSARPAPTLKKNDSAALPSVSASRRAASDNTQSNNTQSNNTQRVHKNAGAGASKSVAKAGATSKPLVTGQQQRQHGDRNGERRDVSAKQAKVAPRAADPQKNMVRPPRTKNDSAPAASRSAGDRLERVKKNVAMLGCPSAKETRPIMSSNPPAAQTAKLPSKQENNRGEAPEDTKTIKRPPDLPTLMMDKSWEQVLERLRNSPLEAQRCHFVPLGDSSQSMSRALPLHLLVTLDPPSSLVQEVINVYSSAASARSSCGRMPLHLACMNGASLNCLKALIFACREAVSTPDGRGRLPLHYACERDTADKISLLLKVDPNTAFMKDVDGMNALAVARKCRNPNIEDITAAVKRYKMRAIKPKPNAVRVAAHTPLRSTGSVGGKTTVEVHCRRSDVTMVGNDAVLPPHTLASIDKEEEVPTSRDERTDVSENPIDSAAFKVKGEEGHLRRLTECSEDSMDTFLDSLEADRIKLSETKQSIANIETKLAASESTLIGLEKDRDETEKEVVSKQRAIDSSTSRIEALKKEIEEEQAKLSQSREELKAADKKLQVCAIKIEEEGAKKSALERDKSALDFSYQYHTDSIQLGEQQLDGLLESKLAYLRDDDDL